MKIEVLHPINHDGKEYGRGVVELPDDLAKLFLTYKHAAQPFKVDATEEVEAAAEETNGKKKKK